MTLEQLVRVGSPDSRMLHAFLFAAVKNAAVKLRPELDVPPPPRTPLALPQPVRRPEAPARKWVARWRRSPDER